MPTISFVGGNIPELTTPAGGTKSGHPLLRQGGSNCALAGFPCRASHDGVRPQPAATFIRPWKAAPDLIPTMTKSWVRQGTKNHSVLVRGNRAPCCNGSSVKARNPPCGTPQTRPSQMNLPQARPSEVDNNVVATAGSFHKNPIALSKLTVPDEGKLRSFKVDPDRPTNRGGRRRSPSDECGVPPAFEARFLFPVC